MIFVGFLTFYNKKTTKWSYYRTSVTQLLVFWPDDVFSCLACGQKYRTYPCSCVPSGPDRAARGDDAGSVRQQAAQESN